MSLAPSRLRLFAFLGALLVLSRFPAAAQEVLRHSLSMDAKAVASGGPSRVRLDKSQTGLDGKPRRNGTPISPTETFTETRYSRERTKNSAIRLEVEVRNLARVADEATLEWYFLARPLEGGGLYIAEEGTQDVTILPGSYRKLPVQSGAVGSGTHRVLEVRRIRDNSGQTTASAAAAAVEKTGSVMGGWIVRLIVEGRPMVVRASSKELQMIGENEGSLIALPREP